MKKLLLALGLCLLPSLAFGQCSGNFTAGNVCGTVTGGPPKQVPITSFAPFSSAPANKVYAGPTSGPDATPTFRSLVGGDLPLPAAVTLGAVFSKTATASQWFRSLGTDGIFTTSQPAFSDLSGSATLAQLPTQAADTFLGNFSGSTAVPNTTSIPNCSGALNYSTTTHLFTCNTSSLPSHPDNIANCSLAASVSGNALTVALKDQTGSDPTALSPCQIAFRSSTAATGTYSVISVTAATSFSTGASGSTFGSTNGVPFRLWITAWDSSGTLVLGVSKQSTTTQVFPINEGVVQSSTACSACTNAASSGVFYTTAAQTSKAIRILGYMDWDAGLATAGVWATGPTKIQVFGVGIKKPGDVLQTVTVSSATQTDTTSSTFQSTNVAASLSPTSTPNLINYEFAGILRSASAATNPITQMHRGATAVGGICGGSANTIVQCAMVGIDAPATISSTTYTVKLKSSDNTNTVNFPYTASPFNTGSGGTVILREIQG